MKLARRTFLHLAAWATTAPTMSRFAWAEAYPSRPVRVIVPFAPGGQTDVVARLISQTLSERLGKQFYIENMPGAGGNIGAGRAAQAAPDGYTILFIDAIGFTASPNLYSKVPYDPVTDFDAVAVGAVTMQVLAVNPSVSAQTV
jgi:tripartite-type tricarboxylate transporter receptor subunit TctC